MVVVPFNAAASKVRKKLRRPNICECLAASDALQHVVWAVLCGVVWRLTKTAGHVAARLHAKWRH